MKSSSTRDIDALGVDQRYRASPSAASNIVGHFHPDPNGGGWVNDRGIEPLIPYPVTLTLPISSVQSTLAPVRFLSVITRHQAAECYYLYEQGGKLQYDMGNKGSDPGVRQTSVLASGRKLPKPDDCGTQITTYGRFNLIVNGFDRMIKWWGRELYSSFGFVDPTPSPVLSPVATDYIQYRNSAEDTPATREGKRVYIEGGETCIRFPPGSYYGLGVSQKSSRNRYDYKVSFITDTGSESPLSPSASVQWVVSSDTVPAGTSLRPARTDYAEGKYGVYISDLPVGPQGTVARRIWRTKNRLDGVSGAGEIYYLVDQIDNNSDTTYVDIIPDQDLNVEAPSSSESVNISSQWKYCATWNNSIWLGGGEQNPYGIIYSKPGLPEQFPAFNYFDVGLREGGAITALVPFYDVLLVFREKSIEIISVNNAGTYSISTLDSNIGTTATNTIKLVAGIGIMFLSKDGVFAIAGSIRGGAVYQVKKMSEVIEKEMGRISLSALPRATATYSEREKEYWVHYPVDGETENSRGSVYHTFNGQWSFRSGNGFYDDDNGMPYTCLATDPNGWIIIGLKPRVEADGSNRRGYPGYGLQVWSANQYSGYMLTNPIVEEGQVTYTITPVQKEFDYWESTWNDLGDDSKKKRILYIEVEVVTSGDNAIELEWAVDWGYNFTSSGSQKPIRPETAGTTSSEASYGTGGGNPAVWGTSVWSQTQVTRLRWDIGSGLCAQFKFRLKSNDMFQVLSYQIEAVGSQTRPLNQNAATSRS